MDDGQCFPHGTSRILTGTVKGFCYQGTWLDCDGSDAAWGGGLGGTYCGNAKAKAGAAGVGEYENMTEYEFCGDDANEAYVPYSYEGNRVNMCCPSNKPYYQESSGSCVNSPIVSDITPPVISNIQVYDLTSNSARIVWTTNEMSDSQVKYGRTLAYGSATPVYPKGVKSHSVKLSGLKADRTYYFRVKSRDATGNLAVSGDKIFKTKK